MKAAEIVSKIGAGVKAALKTNQLFLGIEQFECENADIHPEYVTTVKVAEHLTAPEHIVSLETHMKTLREQALRLARIRNLKTPDKWRKIEPLLRQYTFGKKDSQRLDILVRSADPLSPPLLLAEAKLGIHNLAGVIEDVNRVARLLSMYDDAELLADNHVYGAIVFHLMQEGGKAEGLNDLASNFLIGINAHLTNLTLKRTWLKHKVDLLSSAQIIEDVCGYREFHDDGTVEDVFGKDRFSFAPGLILLGNADDIEGVPF